MCTRRGRAPAPLIWSAASKENESERSVFIVGTFVEFQSKTTETPRGGSGADHRGDIQVRRCVRDTLVVWQLVYLINQTKQEI